MDAGEPPVLRRGRARSRTRRVSRSAVSVTRLATIEVVPWARWASARRRPPPPYRSSKEAATAAVHVGVDEAGDDGAVAAGRGRPAAGGAPCADLDDPVAVERGATPARRVRAGVMTWPAEMSTVTRTVSASTSDSSSSSSRPGVLQVPLADHEAEQEVVDRGVAQPDRDEQEAAWSRCSS